MNKLELRSQIAMLRTQMDKLEIKCQKREDKIVKLIFLLEPFLNALSPEIHKQILEAIEA
jgi:hypothetical protein